MKCAKCRQDIDDDLQFCPFCGRAVDSKGAFTSESTNKSNKKKRSFWNLFKKK